MGEMGGRPAARMGAAVGGQVGESLGMDRRELGAALRGGASIADLAGDRADELVADLVARGTERIEQAVADGRLDRERARPPRAEQEPERDVPIRGDLAKMPELWMRTEKCGVPA